MSRRRYSASSCRRIRRQRRSYFAVKLPQRWWLLGIDIQFDTYIDKPQMDYFRHVASLIQDGDGIILCNAKPSWVDGGTPIICCLDSLV